MSFVQNSLRHLQLFLLLVLLTSSGYSQDVAFHAGLFSFFDNIEFGQSAVKIPQTMSGVQFAPEMAFGWDSVNRLNVGVNLMHEFGSRESIDKLYPTAFYEYNKKPFRFIMGAFPRDEVTGKYPRLFFQDSISYYRPNLNGIYIGYCKKGNYLDLWLDWTGRQSDSIREAFFVGINGKYSLGPFYARHTSCMYHFAGKMNPVVDEALHDNLLFLTSIGIDLSGKSILDKLDFNAGWVAAAERARSENTGWILLSGFLAEVRAEYKYIGLYNSFYTGEKLYEFYGDHSNELYWGDPAYRAKTYNRSDIYLKFFNNRIINVELAYSLHFLEKRVYHEQMLKVRVNLNVF
jgi:hypothetical protein